ncbi:MAG: PqqD family protein [Firmicutes bacterium]|nr:PqqD family protein [Bacillota bacterium]
MKIKEGFILRKVGIQFVVAATGKASEHFNGMMRLNESGAFAFRLMQQGITEEELTIRLMEEYEVSEETARKDVAAFTAALREADALE